MSNTFHEDVAFCAASAIDALLDKAEPMFLDHCRELALLVTGAARASGKDWLDIEFRDMVIDRAFFDDMLGVALQRESAAIFSINNGDMVTTLPAIAESCFDVISVATEFMPAQRHIYLALFDAPLRGKYAQLHTKLNDSWFDNQRIDVEEAELFRDLGEDILLYLGETRQMTLTAHQLNAGRFLRYAYGQAIDDTVDQVKISTGAIRRTHIDQALYLSDRVMTYVEFAKADKALVPKLGEVYRLARLQDQFDNSPIGRILSPENKPRP